MKSATWLVLTFIFIFSAIYVFKHEKYIKRIEIMNGYCVNLSVNKGQEIEFFFNPKKVAKKGIITINNLNGSVVDSFIIKPGSQIAADVLKIEKNADLYTEKFSFRTENLEKGMYLLGNKIPFIIKDNKKKSAIKVIFPFLALQAISDKGGKSFINYHSTENKAATILSLNRTLVIDDYTKNLIAWLNKNYPNQFEIVTDYEIGENQFKPEDLLIMYGNCAYIPLKIKKTIEKSINSGTKAFVISSTLFQSIIRLDLSKKTIAFYPESKLDPEKIDTLKTGLATDPIFNDNTYFQFGLASQFTNSGHFDSLKSNIFYIKSNLDGNLHTPKQGIQLHDMYSLSGVELNEDSSKKGKYNTNYFQKFEHFEILAEAKVQTDENSFFIGNIVYLKKTKQSGKQISIGSNDWLNTTNLNKQDVSDYTKSCIDFLMN